MTETWKPIPSAPGYFASDLGRVLGPRKVLRSWPNQNGYLCVNLYAGGRHRPQRVHRLVTEAFHGPCPAGKQCRHRDGVRTNNVPGNLCWGTPVQNAKDKLIHGTYQVGGRNGSAKLTISEALQIHRRVQAGERYRALAREFGVSRHNVMDIAAGRTWRWLTHPSIRPRAPARSPLP